MAWASIPHKGTIGLLGRENSILPSPSSKILAPAAIGVVNQPREGLGFGLLGFGFRV